ncbi:hypothetical protein R1flu_013919 [Riccia fluitans]|uniref:S5 DRBM domain-containing protein n=1 Tax=Riccia fluitans TaxID=41844 RepID=A0ABD1YES3_9MARC
MAGRACLQALRLALVLRTNVSLQQIADGGRQLSSAASASGCGRRSDTLASKSMLSSAGWFPDCRLRWISSGPYSDGYPVSLSQDTGEGGNGDAEIAEEFEEISTGEEGSSNVDLALDGVPRRKQRFLLQKALKIKSERDEEERPRMPRGFEMKVIDVNRTVKVTKGGKVQSFGAVVICGNHNGVVGYGKGKSSEVGPAIDKACMRALENLHYFDRYHGHTIFHEHDSTYEKTKVYLWPAMSGTGMKASHTVGGILRLAGYQNVKSKVIGSRHPLNTVKAVFQALSEIESPEEVAERRGRPVVESHLLA